MRKGQLVELAGNQNPSREAPPRSKRERREQGDVRGRLLEKSRYIRIIARKEVIGHDPIKYFPPTGVRSTFRFPEIVIAVEVLPE